MAEILKKLTQKIILVMVGQTFAYLIVFGGIALNDHFKLKNTIDRVNNKLDADTYFTLQKSIEQRNILWNEAIKAMKEDNTEKYSEFQKQLTTINNRIDEIYRKIGYLNRSISYKEKRQ